MLGLKTIDKNITVSSKNIAETFGKLHKDVIRAISRLDCSQEFRGRNFTPSKYTSVQNKKLSCFDVSRDGFAFLAMGFTGPEAGKWKEKYINAFNQMESALNGSVEDSPKSMEELNGISKRIENLNEVGSFHGKGLAGFARSKRKETKIFKEALNSAQMVLGV